MLDRGMGSLELTLAGIVAVIWVLSRLARRNPHVGWLQPFANAFPTLPSHRTAGRRGRQEMLSGSTMPGSLGGGALHGGASVEPLSRTEQVFARREIRERRRRGVYAGAELILLGIVIPMGYYALKAMFWTEPTRSELALVATLSILSIGAGIVAIATSSRSR